MLYISYCIISAIIITGSEGVTEILRENGSYWCLMPDLPHRRIRHTQSGLITCGGHGENDTDTSCLTFSDGQWRETHQLQKGRVLHSSWMSQQGLVLLGGYGGGENTTEILTDDGGSLPSFTLKYDTSSACTIELDDQVIVTGGHYTLTRVDIYTMNGWVRELPDLISGRRRHGCGHYFNNDNKMVLLVTGGFITDGDNFTILSSTETLVEGSSAWANAGELPVALQLLRGVSLNNNIFMTGGYDGSDSHDSILQFNPEDGSWTQVGQLQTARHYHGASVVSVDDIIDYCN